MVSALRLRAGVLLTPGWGVKGKPSFIKNTKNWYTIDALGAIFAIFIILDTFSKLSQYFYNTFKILLE